MLGTEVTKTKDKKGVVSALSTLSMERQEMETENMKCEQCWPRSVCKVPRHEGSLQRKSCMRTQSRKT